MTNIKAWLKWELSRRIVLSPALKLIAVYCLIKGVLFTGGGAVLLFLSHWTALGRLLEQWQTALSAGNSLWHYLLMMAVATFAGLSHWQQDAVGIVVTLLGIVALVEAFGLFLKRRWAEYLVLIATGAFLPLEVLEVVREITILPVVVLLVNLLIVVYLVKKKRLFLEKRPRHDD